MSNPYQQMSDEQRAAMYQQQNAYAAQGPYAPPPAYAPQQGYGQPAPYAQQPVYGQQQPQMYGAPVGQQQVYAAPQQVYGAPQQQQPYAQQYAPQAGQPQATYAPPVHHHHHDAAGGKHAAASPEHPMSPSHYGEGVGGVSDAKFAASPNKCRDMGFAIAFVLHVIGIFVLAGVMYKMYAHDLARSDDDGSDSGNNELRINGKAMGILGAAVGVGVVMSAVWLELFKWYASTLIWFCLILSPVVQFILAGLFFTVLHAPIAGVIFLITGALNCLYIFLVRHRIAFSAHILTIVVQVLQQFPATTAVAFAAIVVQVVWVLVWVVAAAGTMHSFRNQEVTTCVDNTDPVTGLPNGTQTCTTTGSSDGSVAAAWFFLLVSFYWTIQCIKNVCHVTTAGVLATWYFLSPNNMPSNPTAGALKRASWTSFGSIALGSLIIAVVKAMRAMAQSMSRADHPVVRCIVLCLLDMLERAVQYFNVYAFTQIAIYGKPYCAAASDTWKLLKSSGIYALVNDDLVGTVLFFASLMTGLVGAGAAAVLAKTVVPLPLWGLWALVGGLISLAICLVAMEVVRSAVIAFFVCWAEDPAALHASKPHLYDAMTAAVAGHKVARPQVYASNPRQGRR